MNLFKYSFILFFFLAKTAFSQDADLQEKIKVDELNKKALLKMGIPDSLKYYSNQAYSLALKANYNYGQGIALKFKGIYEHGQSNFDSAIKYYTNALNIFKALNNELEIGKANLNIATSFNGKLDYPKVITYGLEALKSFKKVKDFNGEGRVLNLLGIISSAQKNYKEALGYFLAYNSLVTKANDKREIGSSFNNIGSTYEKLNKPDSAIYYYQKSLALTMINGSASNIGKLYQNIGGLYNSKKDGKNALVYHNKSRLSYEEAGDRKFLSHSYFNIGLSYKQLKDTINAKKWLLKAIDLSTEVKETEILKESYQQLSLIESAQNNFKSAFESLKTSISMKDSILDIEKTKLIEDLKTKYETEKKEQEILTLNQKNLIQRLDLKQKNIFLWSTIIGLFLVTLLAYVVINKRKIKAEAKMQQALHKQQELATREVLDAEERERRRIAGDLHDGLGQTLSAALMNLNGLISKLDFKTKEEEKLASQSLSLVNESYDEMRSISHQMMPNALLKAGLAVAVREFISKIDENKLKVSLETTGLQNKLDEQIETVIYRVIQEITSNVIKHAKASKMSIQIANEQDEVTISIEDNGLGFDTSKLGEKEGIGIKNIKTRIASLNGTIDYDSKIGKGTLVNIYIPLLS